MQALSLIKFLLPPRPGRIHSLNSPFDQDDFAIRTAQAWVERGKAIIEDGVLVFTDDFRYAIVRHFHNEELSKRADQAYEQMCDLTQSDGRYSQSTAVWRGRHCGKRPMPGGPQNKTKQMIRIFKKTK